MTDPLLPCPACNASLRRVFNKKVLNKYLVDYFECSGCGLVKTENPYWLSEAYSSAIADLDTGLVQRNIRMSELTAQFIERNFDPSGVYLDFAGGYGLFVRLMRDKGFDFYWTDKYCANLFAHFFSHSQAMASYDLVTAFELFEHLNDPLTQVQDIARISDTILFTTEIRPSEIRDVEEWWYLVPETGQHVTFYSLKSLESLAETLGMRLYSDGRNTHIFSVRDDLVVFAESQTSTPNLLKRLASRLGRRQLKPAAQPKNTRQSLIWSDHEKIKKLLRERGDTDECWGTRGNGR